MVEALFRRYTRQVRALHCCCCAMRACCCVTAGLGFKPSFVHAPHTELSSTASACFTPAQQAGLSSRHIPGSASEYSFNPLLLLLCSRPASHAAPHHARAPLWSRLQGMSSEDAYKNSVECITGPISRIVSTKVPVCAAACMRACVPACVCACGCAHACIHRSACLALYDSGLTAQRMYQTNHTTAIETAALMCLHHFVVRREWWLCTSS